MEKIVKFFLFALCCSILTAPLASEAKSRKKPKTPKTVAPPSFSQTEIKFILSENSHEAFLNWVKNQKSLFEQKHVFFFDSKNLDLLKNGIILRVRRMQDETFDSNVKVRTQDIEKFPELSIKSKKNLSCEVDLINNTQMKTCDLSRKEKKILPSIDSKNADSFFNKDQSKFAKFFFNDLRWSELVYWGRIISNKWELQEAEKKINCELWTLPNLKRIIECSLISAVENQETEKKFLSEFLEKNKLAIENSTKSKTETALEILLSSQTPESKSTENQK